MQSNICKFWWENNMTSDSQSQHINKATIIDFLLNELSYEKTIETDRHIRECEQCRSAMDSYVQLFGKLRSQSSEPVHSDTYFQLKSLIFDGKDTTGKPVQKSLPHIMQRLSFVLSAAAVLAVTVLLTGGIYLNEIPTHELTLYESWFVDTSLVNTNTHGYYTDDSLLQFSRDRNAVVSLSYPYIKLKTRAAINNVDQFAGQPHTAGLRKSNIDFFPWLPKKGKIISFKYIPRNGKRRPRSNDSVLKRC